MLIIILLKLLQIASLHLYHSDLGCLFMAFANLPHCFKFFFNERILIHFMLQMLHNLGIEAFVGGNLGTPLSKAAKQCLEAPTQRQPYQVISLVLVLYVFRY